MLNTVLFVVVFSVFWRMTDGNLIQMCDNKTLTTNSILLVRNDKNSPTNCWCQIISETGSLTKVAFHVSSLIGHQYRLSGSHGISTKYITYGQTPDISYALKRSEEVKLQLEGNNCSANDGLEFGININSSSGNINITCHNSTVSTPELCPQDTSDATTTSTSTITSTVTTKPSDTAPNDTYTNAVSSTEKASEATTNSQNDKTTNSTDMEDLVLIGGLVGGAVLLIILLLILIICLVRRKRRKKDGYDRPLTQARLSPDAGYANIDIGQLNNNSSPVGMVIEDNPVYHSSDNADSVSPRHKDTNLKSGDPIQMEIIENDLYVSSDDVMNFNQTPEVEYSVVNKKRHSDKPSKETSEDSGVSISSNEPNSDLDRKFVLGPKGDEYTLVTKT